MLFEGLKTLSGHALNQVDKILTPRNTKVHF